MLYYKNIVKKRENLRLINAVKHKKEKIQASDTGMYSKVQCLIALHILRVTLVNELVCESRKV